MSARRWFGDYTHAERVRKIEWLRSWESMDKVLADFLAGLEAEHEAGTQRLAEQFGQTGGSIPGPAPCWCGDPRGTFHPHRPLPPESNKSGGPDVEGK